MLNYIFNIEIAVSVFICYYVPMAHWREEFGDYNRHGAKVVGTLLDDSGVVYRPVTHRYECRCGLVWESCGTTPARAKCDTCPKRQWQSKGGRPPKVKEGDRVGRLTVVGRVNTNQILCVCDCGNEVRPVVTQLVKGAITECARCGNRKRGPKGPHIGKR